MCANELGSSLSCVSQYYDSSVIEQCFGPAHLCCSQGSDVPRDLGEYCFSPEFYDNSEIDQSHDISYTGSGFALQYGLEQTCITDDLTLVSSSDVNVASSSSVLLPHMDDDVHLESLAKVICFGYGFNTNFEDMEGIFEDDFFQRYATRNNYQLVGSFLSDINKYKLEFAHLVNDDLYARLSLPELYDSFQKLGANVFSRNFCKFIFDFRNECIVFLQSKFIPKIVSAVFSLMVIDKSCERKMKYPEMEQFFLYYVTTLERIIMLVAMAYQSDFCGGISGKISLPLLPCINYRNPFVDFDFSFYAGLCSGYSFDCPAAFDSSLGVPISFVASNKIYIMIKLFSKKYYDSLLGVVHGKLAKIAHYSYDSYADDFLVFKDTELLVLVKQEFDVMMAVDIGHISSFLAELILWREVDLSKLLEKIGSCIFCFLSKEISCWVGDRIRYYNDKISRSLERVTVRNTMSTKWGSNLHPKFNYNISSLSRSFPIKIKPVILKVCYEMINNGCCYYWGKVSGKLVRTVNDRAKLIIEEHSKDIYDLVSKTPVVGSGGVLEKLTDAQVIAISGKIYKRFRSQLRAFTKLLWEGVVSGLVRDPFSAVNEGSLSVTGLRELSLSISGEYGGGSSVHHHKNVYASNSSSGCISGLRSYFDNFDENKYNDECSDIGSFVLPRVVSFGDLYVDVGVDKDIRRMIKHYMRDVRSSIRDIVTNLEGKSGYFLNLSDMGNMADVQSREASKNMLSNFLNVTLGGFLSKVVVRDGDASRAMIDVEKEIFIKSAYRHLYSKQNEFVSYELLCLSSKINGGW